VLIAKTKPITITYTLNCSLFATINSIYNYYVYKLNNDVIKWGIYLVAYTLLKIYFIKLLRVAGLNKRFHIRRE